jgi:hypothetical protein
MQHKEVTINTCLLGISDMSDMWQCPVKIGLVQ